MNFKTVFVTVGTTRFDSLVETICKPELQNTLRTLGCTRLIIQYGNGDEKALSSAKFDGIQVERYRLKPSILPDIRKADLIISHAGAGSCMEVLRERKPLVVVINEELMGNHQVELAAQLQYEGHLFYSTPLSLQRLLIDADFNALKPYEKGDLSEFMNQLDSLMGFK